MTSTIALLVGGLLASVLLTALAIRYAAFRQMLDHPGQRRSHTVPTPRGGGIAPVLVILCGGAWLALHDPRSTPAMLACLGGLGAVAGIGWIDDHRPLPASWRLLVHVMASTVAAIAVCGLPQTFAQSVGVAGAVLAITSLVNIWNFMDGIDGIAGSQIGLVVAAMLAGGWSTGAWREFDGVVLVAVAGFLPFNLVRARIFLGDVGSGAFGYLVAILLLQAVVSGALPWPLAVLPVSAFLVDAGLTLGWRVLRGKAWWRPHREHLYQWLVRRGYTHQQVAGVYALWTVIASVLAVLLAPKGPAVGLAVTSAVISFGTFAWVGCRNCLWTAARSRH